MSYDAIIVGARVAGSATALLLARKGYKILLVDKAVFPSDTISTHYIHAAGAARLNRWGLLDRLRATGCPGIREIRFDLGAFDFTATTPPAEGGIDEAFAPRRTVLDKLMADAAVEAGCEFRERYPVTELSVEGGCVTGIQRESGSKSARIVIGADGAHSLIARLVDAPRYRERSPLSCVYYAYWSGTPVSIMKLHIKRRSTVLTFPTNGGLTMAAASFAIADFPRIRLDHEAVYLHELPEYILAGRRETRVFGTADLPNFYRRPYGNGWALVGDAGYHKDPLSAQGITDAFRDAELLSEALDRTLHGDRESLAGYEAARDAAPHGIYEFTLQRASYEPPPPEMRGLLKALAQNQDAANRYAGIDAGTMSFEEFFAPENVARIAKASASPGQ